MSALEIPEKPSRSRYKKERDYRKAMTEYQGKLDRYHEVMKHFNRGKPRGKTKNSKAVEVIKTVVQLIGAGLIIWLFASLAASTFGTSGANTSSCTGSGYMRTCD